MMKNSDAFQKKFQYCVSVKLKTRERDTTKTSHWKCKKNFTFYTKKCSALLTVEAGAHNCGSYTSEASSATKVPKETSRTVISKKIKPKSSI